MEVLVATARLLVHQLEVLERKHRDGLEPLFGELQDLFETKAVLRRQVEAHVDPVTPLACVVPGCPLRGPVVVAGQPYCQAHGAELRDLQARLDRLVPAAARLRVDQVAG